MKSWDNLSKGKTSIVLLFDRCWLLQSLHGFVNMQDWEQLSCIPVAPHQRSPPWDTRQGQARPGSVQWVLANKPPSCCIQGMGQRAVKSALHGAVTVSFCSMVYLWPWQPASVQGATRFYESFVNTPKKTFTRTLTWLTKGFFFFKPISEDVCFYNLMATCDLVLRSLSLQVLCKENCFVCRKHLIAGRLKLMHGCT